MTQAVLDLALVSIADRSDLVPLVAGWIWQEFERDGGFARADVEAMVAGATARMGVPQTFVLLAGGEAVGTSSFVAHDLDDRLDLTPWLASVYVRPDMRGRGYVKLLVASVETACRDAAVSPLWLYTSTAERIYAALGWQTVDRLDIRGQCSALMRKDVL